MSSKEDFYLVLEIGRLASVNDIKRAFRKLARRYHPDINPGDRSAEERFKLISEAYEILSDPRKRRFYDEHGFYSDGVLDPRAGKQSWGFAFQGFGFSDGRQSPLGEMFGQFFSRQAARRNSDRGQDVECQVSITFDDSISGLATRLSVQRCHACTGCQGTGRLAGQRDAGCPACTGTGTVTRMKGRLQFTVACTDCGGNGRVVTNCPDCGGESTVPCMDILDVELPAGLSSGSRVRIPGKGDAGRFGGPPGDLFVITNVAAHPFFSRVGDNIQCTLPITFSEAALGARIQVPTVDGKALMRVPPGTQNGHRFRLRGRGAPSLLRPGTRGDQFVEVRVVVPRIADERSKEILREFARLNSEDPRMDIEKLYAAQQENG